MSYSMERAASLVSRKSISEELEVSTQSLVLTSSVVHIMESRLYQKRKEEEAQKIMGKILESYQDEPVQKDEVLESINKGIGWIKRSLGRLLVGIGRFMIRRLVQPILSFAARAALAVGRFAIRFLMRGLIGPILTALSYLFLTPVGLAILGVTALGAGLYWVWNKFFRKKEAAPATEKRPSLYERAKEVVTQKIPSAISETFSIKPPVQQPPQPALIPSIDKSKGGKFQGFGATIDSYIKEAASRYDIPEDTLRGFVKMEAGWTGKMSPTGAIGVGQFIQSTWNELAATSEGKAIGMIPITPKTFRTPQDPRYDQRVNTLATGLLAKKNSRLLTNAGLPITGENLYMLHNIGPGIIPVMQGKPASAATLKAMKQNGMLAGQTAKDFLDYQKKRFLDHYTLANSNQTQIETQQAQFKDGITKDRQKKKIALAQTTSPQPMSSIAKDDVKEIIRGPGRTLVGVS